jgi:hypothetical protein
MIIYAPPLLRYLRQDHMIQLTNCRSCAVAKNYVFTIKGVGRLLTVFIAIANQTNDFAIDR